MRTTIVSLCAALALVGLMWTVSAADNGNKEVVDRGRYLVEFAGCSECHTPWRMGPNGPEQDIDRLVAKDLVERRPDPTDRRAWRLYLKEEVQPVLDAMRALSETVRGEALAGIATDRREALIDDLLRMKTNLSDRDDAGNRRPAKRRSRPQPTPRKQKMRQAHGT